MKDSWKIDSTSFADLEVKELRGAQGLGFYQLIVHVDVTTHPSPSGKEITVTNIRGEAWARGKDGKEHFFGPFRRKGTDLPIVTYQHMGTNVFELEIDLEPRRIEAIENIRLGEDLAFKLCLYGIANTGREKSSIPMSGTSSSSNKRTIISEQYSHPVSVNLGYHMNQSAWIKILDQMGYRKTMLLEIPLPNGNAGVQFPEASKYLQEAQTQFLNGHFREAVGLCRDVVESISVSLNDEKDKMPPEIDSWFENSRNMSKEERIRILRRAFKLLTHPARHADKNAISIEWKPEDARTILIMLTALLQISVE